MKLEYTHERQKVIDGLIKKSFKIDKLYVHDQENTDDWVSNMEILKHLFAINDLIATEKISSTRWAKWTRFAPATRKKKIFT